MCISKDLLARFYGSLDFSLRVLIHYRVLVMYGKPFDQFLIDEPWSVYDVLATSMGKHNADMFLHVLKNWLERHGCKLSLDDIKNFLSKKELWT
ncbi:MAG: hypothetical protein ABWJ97_04870 [Thermoproteus sp.]